MSATFSRAFALLMTTALMSAPAMAAPDWNKIEAKKVYVFYPAQVSWERLFTPGRHSGQRRFGQKTCFGCHGGIDEPPLGDSLVHAEKDLEPDPIPKKPGSLTMQVKTAHDATNFYIRMEFDPGEQPNAEMDKTYETKVAMMIDDGSVPEMATAGCWIVCHANAASMPAGKGTDTTKYISNTRASMGTFGGDELKAPEDIEKLRAGGNFIEYWQAKIKQGSPVVSVDGSILEKRAENMTHAVTATATKNAAGIYTVTFTRKLKAGAPYKDIVPDKTYTLGFAVHAGYTTQRFHYVSYERSMVLDSGTADFVAANVPSAPPPKPPATAAAPSTAPAAPAKKQ